MDTDPTPLLALIPNSLSLASLFIFLKGIFQKKDNHIRDDDSFSTRRDKCMLVFSKIYKRTTVEWTFCVSLEIGRVVFVD